MRHSGVSLFWQGGGNPVNTTESIGENESSLNERYQIRSHLARRGSADAYLARDTQLKRDVVIKRVRSATLDAAGLRKVHDEAAIMASLKHSSRPPPSAG
jgi:serine/threonine protein kinase